MKVINRKAHMSIHMGFSVALKVHPARIENDIIGLL
jgi:hypothetical protein